MLRSLTFGLDNEPGSMGTAEAGGVAGGKEVHFHSPEAKGSLEETLSEWSETLNQLVWDNLDKGRRSRREF